MIDPEKVRRNSLNRFFFRIGASETSLDMDSLR